MRGAEKGHGLMCGMIWPNARSRVRRASQRKRKHTLHTLWRRFCFTFQLLNSDMTGCEDFLGCGDSVCCEWRWEKIVFFGSNATLIVTIVAVKILCKIGTIFKTKTRLESRLANLYFFLNAAAEQNDQSAKRQFFFAGSCLGVSQRIAFQSAKQRWQEALWPSSQIDVVHQTVREATVKKTLRSLYHLFANKQIDHAKQEWPSTRRKK